MSRHPQDSSRRSHVHRPDDRPNDRPDEWSRRANSDDAYEARERRSQRTNGTKSIGYSARDDYQRAGRSRKRSERHFDPTYDDNERFGEGFDEESLRWSSWNDLEKDDKRIHPRKGVLERLPLIKRIKQPGLRVAAAITLVAVLLLLTRVYSRWIRSVFSDVGVGQLGSEASAYRK